MAASIDPQRAADLPVRPEQAGDTTYFCVVDAAGNAVSAIQSINSAFGSGVTAGDTGVLLNNRMAYWHLEEGHPNRLRPGMRVRHTMNAPMVFKDGKLWGVFGTPGADNQVQVNLQVMVAMAVFGLDPQQALEMPRWTSNQLGQPANYPHAGDAVLTLEAGLADAAEALRGHGAPGEDRAAAGRPLQRRGDPRAGERRAHGRQRPAPRRLGGGLLRRLAAAQHRP